MWTDYFLCMWMFNSLCFIVLHLLLCQRLIDYIFVSIFLALCSIHWSICLIPYCVDYCHFYSKQEVSSLLGNISSPALLFNIVLAIVSLWFSIQNLESVCRYSQNDFLRYWLSLKIKLGKIDISVILIFLPISMEYLSTYLLFKLFIYFFDFIHQSFVDFLIYILYIFY